MSDKLQKKGPNVGRRVTTREFRLTKVERGNRPFTVEPAFANVISCALDRALERRGSNGKTKETT